MNNGVYQGHRILENETIELIRTIQFPSEQHTRWYSYGLGWRVSVFNGTTSIGHVGAMPGVANFMTYEPSLDVGFIFFTNQYPIITGYDFMSWINILILLYEKSATY
jgi:CubicO group peptidase (beta-lactamase class C family)